MARVAARIPCADRAGTADAAPQRGHESGGNFANDPQRASEAGQKGGHESGGQR
ncbi:KGG domain-containing protein [Streptomyces sp. NPDC048196]|uniref:general stress protein n=1 Tax=Streptomyces sp. NPDC048196 TaxID=3154712 RepID=UPI0033E8629E